MIFRMEKLAFFNLRIYKIVSFIIGLVVLASLIYAAVNYSTLQESITERFGEHVQNYGYAAVFLLTFLVEISPQPFVSSIFPMITGFIIGLDFYTLFSFTISAVIISSLFSYYLGIYLGKRATSKIIGEENYDKAQERFDKYGRFGMAILALTPIPYFPIVAGLFKMNLSDFILYGIIPRILHFIILSLFLFWVL